MASSSHNPASLAAGLNLEFYRKRAKALLKAARTGDGDASARLKRYGAAGEPALHAAQLAIAREQGFASWPRFVAFLTESGLDFRALTARFITTALLDARRAEEMLAEYPDLAHAGVHAALVLGDWARIAAVIEADPDFAIEKSGPHTVEAIAYACFSRFGRPGAERAESLALTLRLLLANGADPNTVFETEHGNFSCIYAASGLLGNAGMTRLLLEAGADPNDGESVYHATEHRDLACLKLLLDHGAQVNGTNALKHMLDREDADGIGLLLAAGCDPNEANPQGDTALHWAVRRGRSAVIVGQLLDAGADIDAARQDGRTAYAMARVSGQNDVAKLLAGRGADTRLSPIDAFAAGEGEAPEGIAASPSNGRMLAHLAETGNIAAVKGLLEAGVPPDVRGDMGETALHWACWRGNTALMRVLLDHGAPLYQTEATYGLPPGGWLHHGATHCGLGDYAGGVRMLMAAGFSGWNTPSGNPAMDAVLRERGLIADEGAD